MGRDGGQMSCLLGYRNTGRGKARLFVLFSCAGLTKQTLLCLRDKLCQQCGLGGDPCQCQGPTRHRRNRLFKICNAFCFWLQTILHQETNTKADAKKWRENRLVNMARLVAILSIPVAPRDPGQSCQLSYGFT